MVLRHLELKVLVNFFTPITRSPSVQTARCSSFANIHFASSRRLRTFSTTFTRSCKMESEAYTFGPYKIDLKEVFYSTGLSYAMVNLRPLLPGHRLISFYSGQTMKKTQFSLFALIVLVVLLLL
ncbi:hypothetical protein RND81_09G191900 [Saponaria officinalis]|uniref:Uncharacterized protein n=1 Tax=Saponaria officinalis TaxID=3572 RepID=A0AAW1IPP6_SAPOF